MATRLCNLAKLFAWFCCCGYVDQMKYVGVDGCRGGWFAVCLDGPEVSFGAFTSFPRLWEVLGDARCILVDIPMGLPGQSTPVRQAEVLARHFLRGRSSSIFSPGCRAVLEAASYRDACEASRKVVGKMISKQYWAIVPKVRDVDSFLDARPEAVRTLRESHPEVCFQAAAGAALTHPKRKPEGIRERLNVLRTFISDIDKIYEKSLRSFYRKTVAGDDILDAMMLAVTARESRGDLVPMPNPPERDEKGLPMAIWYHEFKRASEEL